MLQKIIIIIDTFDSLTMDYSMLQAGIDSLGITNASKSFMRARARAES